MSTVPAVEGAPEPGTVIAEKYRVLCMLGSGGMGCLVKAEHLLLKKTVAIKFILGNESAQTRGRLFREARAAQSLSSENVVRVFDLGVHGVAPYIVMELLEGVDLSTHVDHAGPLGVEEAVDCLLEACVGVAEAHAVGIIHRDIKPSNLFSTRTATLELVKVLDFGISKVPEPLGNEDCEKTGTDTVLGSPYYMSPEQLRNPANVDVRTDVWSLGVSLFYLLTGEHPFEGPTVREVTAGIFTDKPRDVRKLRPEVPEALWRVIAGTLVKRPEDRFASVSQLVHALVPFASKRGRLAAERVAAMGSPSPSIAPIITRKPPPSALSTTDAGLSATLKTTADSQRPAKLPRAAAATEGTRDRTRSRAAALVAIAVVAGAATIAWFVMPPGNTTPLRATAWMSRASTLSDAVLRRAASDEPAAPPVLPPPPASPSGPEPHTASAVAKSRPGAPVAPASAEPSASASAAPPPPPQPRRDIDGIPIVD